MSSKIYVFKKNTQKHIYSFSFLDIINKEILTKIKYISNVIFFLKSNRKTNSSKFVIKIKKFNYDNIFNKKKDLSFLDNIFVKVNVNRNKLKKNAKIKIFKKLSDLLKKNYLISLRNFCQTLGIYLNSDVSIKLYIRGGGISSIYDSIVRNILKFVIFCKQNCYNKDDLLEDNINKNNVLDNINQNNKLKETIAINSEKMVKYFGFYVNAEKLENYRNKKKSDFNSIFDDKKILLINTFVREDIRQKERSKVGKSGARRSEQFSKR